MRIPRVRHRLNERVETINKSKMVEVMHELEPDRMKKLLREDYDRVTRAINGILNAYARDLPKGTHLRLRLNDCVTINLCWMAGKPGAFAPYPNTWISLSRQLRDRLRKLRAAEFKAWKHATHYGKSPVRDAIPDQQIVEVITKRMEDACKAMWTQGDVDAFNSYNRTAREIPSKETV